MKKYKLLISNNYALNLSLPTLSREKKLDSLIKIIFFVGLNLLFIFFALLASSGEIGGNSNVETNYFNFIFLFILLSYVGYFIVLILNGSKLLVDPVNFLSVLIFALLTTAAAVLAMPASVTNTFGILSLRGLSGAFILLAIGLFYLINVYIKDRTLSKRAWYTLTFGFIGYFFLLVVLSYSGNSMIPNNIFNVAPLFILLGGTLLHSRLPKLLPIVSIVVVSLITLLAFTSFKGVLMNLYSVILSLSITAGVFSIYFLIVNRKYLKNRIKELKLKKNSGFKTRLKLALPFLVLLSPIFLFLSGFVVQIALGQSYLAVFNNLGDIKVAFENLFSNTTTINSGSRILVGLGGRVLNPEFSLISNVISSQGLLGLLAYVFLAVSTLFLGFKLLNKMIFVSRDYKFVLSIFFILIYGVVVSLFAYPGILTITIWWIALALLSVFYRVFIYRRNVVYQEDLNFVLSNKMTFFKGKLKLQYVFSILVFVVGVISFLVLCRINY